VGQTTLKEALFWQQLGDSRVQCQLCPHGCRLSEEQVGLCRVRRNLGGVLRSLNYGRVSSVNMDPIEKKPLFHFHPGSMILSLGTIGCNLACAFCQNWTISQSDPGTRRMSPAEAVRLAQSHPDNLGIAYTYNEPFIWYEFVLETAEAARSAGQKNVLVTNGYVEEEPLRRLLPFIDAMNVDIKSVRDAFYRELCRGRAEPPRRTVEIAKQAGCLVEITNLVIPNWNDSEEDLKALVEWAAGVDVDMPLHFSRYHPDYKFSEPPTPAETLTRARALAEEKLHYVYLGNLWGGEGEDTRCHHCGKVVVERRGFSVGRVSVAGGKCGFCGGEVPVVGP
jgi:pyruvate formate lyase activating enzyme